MEIDPAPSLPPAERDALVRAITRPEPRLMTFYVLVSLFTGPFFPIALVPLFFRYKTLRYGFDEDGISVSWGILFRREHHLTYRRIQDIHVTRNLLERWLGIGKVSVQTASGSGSAEAEIVGVKDFAAIRDFLYTRMRGHEPAPETTATPAPERADDPLALLTEIRDALRALNEHVAGTGESGGEPS